VESARQHVHEEPADGRHGRQKAAPRSVDHLNRKRVLVGLDAIASRAMEQMLIFLADVGLPRRLPVDAARRLCLD
jgi:hypothetical protein